MSEFIKNKKNILLVGLLCLITIIPFLSSGILHDGDVTFHLNRLVGIGDAIRDGQFIPKIYPYTNNGYGYAIPLFYCDLFLYPFAIIHMLGVPLVISYKLMLASYNIVGIVLMYLVAKKMFKKGAVATTVTIVYALHGYRYIDLFMRNAVGEFLALCFIPLVIYSFYKLFIKHQCSFITLALSMSAILLSHNLTFVLVCLIYVIGITTYAVVHRKDKERLINLIMTTIKAAIVGLLLCSWYIFPMLEQFNDQLFNVNLYGDLADISSTLIGADALIPSFMGLNEEFIFSIDEINRFGLNIVVVFVACIALFRKYQAWVKILAVMMLLFVAVSMGIIPLHLISFFNVLQFSFRWYIVVFALSIIPCALVLSDVKVLRGLVIAFLLGNIVLVSSQIRSDDVKVIDNFAIKEEIFDISKSDRTHNNVEISGAEYLPPTEKNDYVRDTKFIKIINDGLYEDIVYDFDRYFSQITFDYSSTESDLLMMPLTYYKGYSVVAYNEEHSISIEAINVDVYKKVGFYTLVGDYTYFVKYNGTMIQWISYAISGITLLIIILYSLKKRFKFKNN